MLGQLGGDDRVGRSVDVVDDAAEVRLPGLGVELQPGGARIAVARLADAPGVHEPAPAADVEARAGCGLGAAGVLDPARAFSSARAKKSATCEWPTKLTRLAWARMHCAAWSGQRTYSQTGSRGDAW